MTRTVLNYKSSFNLKTASNSSSWLAHKCKHKLKVSRFQVCTADPWFPWPQFPRFLISHPKVWIIKIPLYQIFFFLLHMPTVIHGILASWHAHQQYWFWGPGHGCKDKSLSIHIYWFFSFPFPFLLFLQHRRQPRGKTKTTRKEAH